MSFPKFIFQAKSPDRGFYRDKYTIDNRQGLLWKNATANFPPNIKSVCLNFVLGQLVIVSWQRDHFWPRYSKFPIWPWKFKFMVNPDGPIWGLQFNQYICFSFHGNWTIFGRDIANSLLDLDYSRSMSWPRSKAGGHIWHLKLNRYVCFSFRGNQTICGRDIANSKFNLENSRSRSRRKSTKI